MKITLLLLIVVANEIMHLEASPSGAPTLACVDMLPRHEAEPQATTSPYEITVTPNEAIKGGSILRVTINALNDASFKGFLLQARGDGVIVGNFDNVADESEPFNLRNCSRPQNTVTHANNNTKRSISFSWMAPADYEGDIYFIATIVQEKTIFWTNQTSRIVRIEKNNNRDIYEGCGTIKTCLGVPNNCIRRKNCDYVGMIGIKDGVCNFELKSPKNAAYVALALSDDNSMGGDSVIECVNEGENLKAYTSLTTSGTGNYGAHRIRVNQNIITPVQLTLEDGSIYCSVNRQLTTTIEDRQFDLITKRYYLLLATGNEVSSESIAYHETTRVVSPRSVLIRESEGVTFEDVDGSNTLRVSVITHGILMIISWIGLTSIGIITAKYCKSLLGKKQILKKDIWFRIHQLCMGLTIILTISAIIIVWIAKGQWSTSWHSIMGIITISLSFFQGFMSLFRPMPQDETRPIFNFMHGSVGKLIHLLAVITIFLATTLPLAQLPSWTKFILTAYIVTYFIFYALLMNSSIFSDIERRKKLKINGDVAEDIKAPLTNVRQGIYVVFLILNTGFEIALIYAIVA